MKYEIGQIIKIGDLVVPEMYRGKLAKIIDNRRSFYSEYKIILLDTGEEKKIDGDCFKPFGLYQFLEAICLK